MDDTQELESTAHYAELAEERLAVSVRIGLGEGARTRDIARAQVYATLALAAATDSTRKLEETQIALVRAAQSLRDADETVRSLLLRIESMDAPEEDSEEQGS